MTKHYFVYGILFPKRDMEIGLFYLEQDFFEGETEANAAIMVKTICERNNWNPAAVKMYVFRKVSEAFLKEIRDEACLLRGLGNDGSGQQREPDGGSGSGGVPTG